MIGICDIINYPFYTRDAKVYENIFCTTWRYFYENKFYLNKRICKPQTSAPIYKTLIYCRTLINKFVHNLGISIYHRKEKKSILFPF